MAGAVACDFAPLKVIAGEARSALVVHRFVEMCRPRKPFDGITLTGTYLMGCFRRFSHGESE